MIRAGLKRAIISVEAPAAATNTLNEIGDSWVPVPDYTDVHAKKRTIRGNEQPRQSGKVGEVVTEFSVRYKPDHGINEECRILQGARVFDIAAVDDVADRHRELRIACRELSRQATTGL